MRREIDEGILELMRADLRVVLIGSDLGAGAFDAVRREFPERFFMEGVSEQYVVGMGAGLAASGCIPFVTSIATFLTRRCYDQIAVDLCIDRLPVRLLGRGAGLSYAPLGPTHMAMEDLAIMRALPDLAVIAPVNGLEAMELMRDSLEWLGPVYFRLGVVPAGGAELSRPGIAKIGRSALLRPPGGILVVSTGTVTACAAAAADCLSAHGVSCGVLHMHTLKPFDSAGLREASREVSDVVVVEEHSVIGGLGSAVLAELAAEGRPLPRFHHFGLPDRFCSDFGSPSELLARFRLDAAGLKERILLLVRAS